MRQSVPPRQPLVMLIVACYLLCVVGYGKLQYSLAMVCEPEPSSVGTYIFLGIHQLYYIICL